MTELAAYIIAESVYTQCDVNGNEYLLLEAFVNNRKNSSALNIENKKIAIKCKKPL